MSFVLTLAQSHTLTLDSLIDWTPTLESLILPGKHKIESHTHTHARIPLRVHTSHTHIHAHSPACSHRSGTHTSVHSRESHNT